MAGQQSTQLCACGCGQFTNIAPQSLTKRGVSRFDSSKDMAADTDEQPTTTPKHTAASERMCTSLSKCSAKLCRPALKCIMSMRTDRTTHTAIW